MNKIIIVILFISSTLRSFSQELNSDLEYSLKFKALEYPARGMTEKYLKKIDSIITKTDIVSVSEIKSKGFTNVNFYKIIIKNKIPELNEDYIMGHQLDKNKFFKLKGFLYNDFYYLYKFEVRIDSESPVNLLSKKNKRQFLKNHLIEGLDLECLIKHIREKENWNIPCLNPSQKILIDDYGEEHF